MGEPEREVEPLGLPAVRGHPVGVLQRLLVFQATDEEVREYFPSVATAYQGSTWYAQTRRLRQIANAVTSRGGRLAVVTFPFLHNLGPEYPFRDAHRSLAEFWRGEGVPHLDLLGTFVFARTWKQARQLYFWVEDEALGAQPVLGLGPRF